jgi:hypothetical protein
MTSNLDLWNKVEKTNPAHTKALKFGRAITAIDAYHQIKNATEQFGPAGSGWGWDVKDTKFLPTDEVAILVSVWHGDFNDNVETRRVEQWGQCSMYGTGAKADKPDGDCMKKATTDGLTKCLSMIGFNADVFLGKFDDNKYVQEVNAEFNNDTTNNNASQGTEDNKDWYNDFDKQIDWFKKEIAGGKTPDALINLLSQKYKINKEVRQKIKNLGGA